MILFGVLDDCLSVDHSDIFLEFFAGFDNFFDDFSAELHLIDDYYGFDAERISFVVFDLYHLLEMLR